jgi:hypothetical protein
MEKCSKYEIYYLHFSVIGYSVCHEQYIPPYFNICEQARSLDKQETCGLYYKHITIVNESSIIGK